MNVWYASMNLGVISVYDRGRMHVPNSSHMYFTMSMPPFPLSPPPSTAASPRPLMKKKRSSSSVLIVPSSSHGPSRKVAASLQLFKETTDDSEEETVPDGAQAQFEFVKRSDWPEREQVQRRVDSVDRGRRRERQQIEYPISPTVSPWSTEESEEENGNDDDEDWSSTLHHIPLRPFRNQVGGHSAIYKFTKRAVCKVCLLT